ncbi:hypothetical protein F442_08748 [Phytophthora nicotianae P10297]|uniref:Uncharacterized protein n=5 Tax=Phytophthora nicotianae TaxID=4792 RepID=W2QA02_PHYN3|nr:hypothetical protein PPTG_11145 [Phytophthora nicotianae INRA-310]ETI46877.1 hypothetical protein F443_08805 [Phytophthora nicotianae P1569]ETK86795.1 hypothetical protein L915_08643 [Phytophthora nicotianae]ETO75569.1 hypothetical protein F444_08874 [Phytophthora nicotianae P1976]ETP44716.1 hypothetical protein F442_08748 [Phytophthora nicotianae P10297]ETL93358.1 hypothetical protein L917_08470 [Phytophthora nicotianae]
MDTTLVTPENDLAFNLTINLVNNLESILDIILGSNLVIDLVGVLNFCLESLAESVPIGPVRTIHQHNFREAKEQSTHVACCQ